MDDRLVITVEYKGRSFATYITDKMSTDQVYVDRVLNGFSKNIKSMLKNNEFASNKTLGIS